MPSAVTAAPPVSPAQPTTASPGVITGAGGKMGKEAFLKLLVAQMTHQDPLNPSDGQEMATQLAQFSSVEQLQNANDTLAQIRDAFAAQQRAQPKA